MKARLRYFFVFIKNKFFTEHRDYKLIKNSNLFDEEWYLNNYPEVSASNSDPIRHYLERGYKYGFDPSVSFSTNSYFKANLDVEKSGMNPLLHYLKFGMRENRPLSYTGKEEVFIDPNFMDLDLLSFYQDANKAFVSKQNDNKTNNNVLSSTVNLSLFQLINDQHISTFKLEFLYVLNLCDAWYSTTQTIRFRFLNKDTNKNITISCYQWSNSQGKANLCVKLNVFNMPLILLDCVLFNPLMPVLMCVEDNETLALEKNLLVFPSLLKKGLHCFESLEENKTPSFRATINLNNKYTSMLREHKRHLIKAVFGVNVSRAYGSEVLLSPYFIAWLEEIFSLYLRPENFDERRAEEVNVYVKSLFSDLMDKNHLYIRRVKSDKVLKIVSILSEIKQKQLAETSEYSG